ncbi:MAG: serpin family protein [Verrucomicrobia bacterium]|nr:serpin family protein [Verrucomicrobiota bacterium]
MNHHLPTLCMTVLSFGIPLVAPAAEIPAAAAQAVNALGLDLLAKGTETNANALLSPYSIQSALAMTYAGAAGDTRTQMARVLHYPADEAAVHQSFSGLQKALEEVAKTTAERTKNAAQRGGPSEPILLTVANRLFGQKGYEFRQAFLGLTKDSYGAPLQMMDFIGSADQERIKINGWVEEQTHQRICDLIPANGLTEDTRLVLVNAIYMKAPWAEEFPDGATKPLPFQVKGTEAHNVPTMFRLGHLGYAKREGYQAITVPYVGGDMQLLVLRPDAKDGLAAVEAKLTPEILGGFANAGSAELKLYLPKFKIEPPLFKLGKVLRTLGMASAFNEPKGSANFDRMAPRKPDDYLYISEVFHKTFLALDEKGTEAAAATAVAMMRATAFIEKPEPIEVRVDRPFLFAIQHRPSGACLFLGRITDPR